jgi:hypothetical protein
VQHRSHLGGHGRQAGRALGEPDVVHRHQADQEDRTQQQRPEPVLRQNF